MIRLPRSCVIDASVVIKLFLPEVHSPVIQAYFLELDSPAPIELYVPDLFYVECTNILWKAMRWGSYTLAQARQDLQNLKEMALASTPTAELFNRAIDIAVAYSITAYDACYVVLGERLSLPVLTADNHFVNTMANTPFPVIALDVALKPPTGD